MWCSAWNVQNQLGDPFGADSITEWGDPARRRALHRRHARNLSVLSLATVAAAALLLPAIAMLLVVLVPLLAFEIWMFRRSRPAASPDEDIHEQRISQRP
jgi:4-hydroxybenzoate polyprenyltransferase